MPKLLVFLALLLAAPMPASATASRYKSFDDLVAEASGIVEGTVTRMRTAKVAESELYTFVTLADLVLHKGAYRGRSLTLRQRGGVIGDVRHVVVGSPQFAVGERVIVFVSANGRAMVPFVGWEQGVFRIEDGRVADSRGNAVLGIEGGRVRKRAALSASLAVLDAEGRERFVQRGGPAAAGASAGRPDNGAVEAETPRVAAAEPAIGRDAFVAAIGEGLARAALRADGPGLTSVEVAPPPRGERAARPPGGGGRSAGADEASDDRPRLPTLTQPSPAGE